MKKLLTLFIASLMLVGCSSNNQGNNKIEGACNTLSVFNTGVYIGDDTLSIFEKETGIKVKYSIFASNEEMYTKLQIGGSNYDVVIPSDYMIGKLIEENRLEKLDLDKIENAQNLYKEILAQDFDPNNEYSLPYFWGNVGIIYDSTVVDQQDVEQMGWNVLKNQKYKGQIYMYDSERDSFMIALKALGYSMNTDVIEELEAAQKWLLELHQTMNPGYVTDEIIDGIINGEKAMGVVYSGDAAYMAFENENLKYYVPQQGTNVWVDAMIIPNDSKCKDEAHEFINFMLRDDIAYHNAETVGYASSIESVLQEVKNEVFSGSDIYIPDISNPNNESFKDNEEVRKIISELWVKVKNS